MKIWHAASNNGINLFKIIVSNNRNYNLKGIIDNYDFCHNRAALTSVICDEINSLLSEIIQTAAILIFLLLVSCLYLGMSIPRLLEITPVPVGSSLACEDFRRRQHSQRLQMMATR